MKYKKQEIIDHAVFDKLDSLIENVKNEESFDNDESDEVISLVDKTLQHTLKIIGGLNEAFIPIQSLNNIKSYLGNIEAELNNLRANRSNIPAQTTNRDNIKSYLDSILISLAQVRG
ncbi:MAG: hypothetical protein ACR2MD_05335, partial [Aridibacter sp.]